MNQTTVVNLRDEPYDIYIGRPGKWGNPFKVTANCPREEAIKKFREYILAKPGLLASIGELRGKRLGCYCKPLACHGDVLVELLKT